MNAASGLSFGSGRGHGAFGAERGTQRGWADPPAAAPAPRRRRAPRPPRPVAFARGPARATVGSFWTPPPPSGAYHWKISGTGSSAELRFYYPSEAMPLLLLVFGAPAAARERGRRRPPPQAGGGGGGGKAARPRRASEGVQGQLEMLQGVTPDPYAIRDGGEDTRWAQLELLQRNIQVLTVEPPGGSGDELALKRWDYERQRPERAGGALEAETLRKRFLGVGAAGDFCAVLLRDDYSEVRRFERPVDLTKLCAAVDDDVAAAAEAEAVL